MRILILDDEGDTLTLTLLQDTLQGALDAEVEILGTVEEAVSRLHEVDFDLVITDVFVPINATHDGTLGRRAARFEAHYSHLGGLVLLDEIDRLERAPKLLIHTACTEAPLIELLDEMGHERVRKPAPVDVLLSASLEAMGLPVPRF